MRRKINPSKALFTKKNKLPSITTLRRKADKLLQDKYVGLNRSCFVCGQVTSEMHHYIPKSQSNYLRYDQNNLIPLCRGCHFRHHNTSDPNIMATILRKKGMGWDELLQKERRISCKFNREYLNKIIERLSPSSL